MRTIRIANSFVSWIYNDRLVFVRSASASTIKLRLSLNTINFPQGVCGKGCNWICDKQNQCRHLGCIYAHTKQNTYTQDPQNKNASQKKTATINILLSRFIDLRHFTFVAKNAMRTISTFSFFFVYPTWDACEYIQWKSMQVNAKHIRYSRILRGHSHKDEVQ